MKDSIKGIVLFGPACSASMKEDICKSLNLNSENAVFSEFSDGEKWLKLKVNIRERRVYIVQPTPQPDSNWIWLLEMIDAARRASAEKIIVISPYFGYARQDRKDQPRVAITCKIKTNSIQQNGTNRIIIMDPHFSQIQGFFDIPCDLLYGSRVFQKQINFSHIDTVIACDTGAVKIAVSYKETLGTNFGVFVKMRVKHNQVEKMFLALENENIENHNVLIVDEMIDTGNTLVKGVDILYYQKKVKKIECAITHGILSGNVIDKINNSPIETLYLLDTIKIPEKKLIPKIKIIRSGYLFAEVIKRVDDKGSLSSLMEG